MANLDSSAVYTVKRTEAIRNQLKKLLEETFDEQIRSLVMSTAEKALLASARLEAKRLQEIIPLAIDVVTPNTAALLATIQKPTGPRTGAVVANWLDRLLAGDQDRVWQTVLNGMITGQTQVQIRDAIIGTRELKFRDGVRYTTRRYAETTSRTIINEVANAGRMDTWRENSDILAGYRWVSTLDTRTTAYCRDRDGKMGPIHPDPDWAPPPGVEALVPENDRPPGHPGCRSTTVAVTKSWRELGFDMDELPAGTRASMDGQVPDKIVWYDWIREQDDERQLEALGPGRFKLWKEKGVIPERFVDDQGMFLTISEIERRNGLLGDRPL